MCNKFGTNNDFAFAIKSDLKDRPYVTIALSIIGFIILLGIAVRTAERSFKKEANIAANMDQLMNVEWLVVITMGTVGYGDFYPSTHIGRLFCTLACILGLVLISMLVVAMNRSSEFDKNQTIAYMAIRNKRNEEKWYVAAIEVIKQSLKVKRSNGNVIEKFKNLIELRKKAHQFKRQTELSSLMDITSAEMLYDLQQKLEGKIMSTKSLISDVPNLQQKCLDLNKKQFDLDASLDRILAQQKTIMGFIDNYITEKTIV